MVDVEKYRWFIDAWKRDNRLTRKECKDLAETLKYDPYNQLVEPEIILQALRELWVENNGRQKDEGSC